MIKSQNTQEKAVLSKDKAQSSTGSDYHNPVSTDNKSVDNSKHIHTWADIIIWKSNVHAC